MINFCGIKKGELDPVALVQVLSEYAEYLDSLKKFIEDLQEKIDVVYHINGIEYFTHTKSTDSGFEYSNFDLFERCVSKVLEVADEDAKERDAAARQALEDEAERESGVPDSAQGLMSITAGGGSNPRGVARSRRGGVL